MSARGQDQEPAYRPGQVLRNLHSWAAQHPPRPVIAVMWDESWGCYTYSFPLSLIQIEENQLTPTGDPDVTAEEWLRRHWEEYTGGKAVHP